ncbi:hypothetical protein D3C81_1057990 [compost metagenome]
MPVIAETGRQLGGKLLQIRHGLAHRDTGRGDGLQGACILLVELQKAVRRDLHVQAHHRGQRHQAAIFGPHVLAIQCRRCQALVLNALRDHVIGAAEQGETVQVLLAHQHAQGFPDGLHADPKARGLGAVDADVHHRVVVVQIAVHHAEQTALAGALLEHFHRLVQHRVILGTAQHHLYRQATTGTWQRRHLEGEDTAPFDVRNRLLQLRLDLRGRTLALLPCAEVDATETGRRAVGAVDDPGIGGFGNRLHHVVEFAGEALHIVQARMLRRFDRSQHRRLVLRRRQLALRQQVQPGQAQAHQQGNARADPAPRQGVSQDLCVGRRQPTEHPLGEVGHGAVLLAGLQQQRTHHRR